MAPDPPDCPPLPGPHRPSSPGGRRRHAQLLRLRRQPGAQVERDHHELRQGEGRAPAGLPEGRRAQGRGSGLRLRASSPQAWAAGDIVSCLIDLDAGALSFCL